MALASFIFAATGHAQNEQDSVKLNFDHNSTGFELVGSHRVIPCESCHTGGQFSGTPRNCNLCHNRNARVNAMAKPIDHIPTSEACDGCHRETFWNDIPIIDHTLVFGACETCHNDVLVAGVRSVRHVPLSNNQCDTCHSSTLAWLPTVMDHASQGIIDGNPGCSGCHNGNISEGKNPGHIPTSDNCEQCHSTIAWIPATVNHDEVAGACIDCHNGNITEGKPNVGHPPSDNQCEFCHSTVAWLPANFDHQSQGILDGSPGCSGCHNGNISEGKNQGHILSSDSCEQCHITAAWVPATVDHLEVLGTCSSCHNGIIASGKGPNHIATNAECDTCHVSTETWNQVQLLPNAR